MTISLRVNEHVAVPSMLTSGVEHVITCGCWVQI